MRRLVFFNLQYSFDVLTTWSLLETVLHIQPPPLPLLSSPLELSERLCPRLKSSVLSAKENRSQLLSCAFLLVNMIYVLNICAYILVQGGKNTGFQFSSVAQSCPNLCNPMTCSLPGLPVHHQLLEFTHSHIHRVGDAIQPCHPLSSPSPPAPNPSQHQSLFQ